MPCTRRILALAMLSVCAGAATLAAQTTRTDRADALAAAARRGDAAAVRALLDAGVDVNTKFRYSATALSYAADHGHLDVVTLLLEWGADVNVKDTFYGATPLTWASGPAQKRKPEHAAIVGLLLARGATGKEGALLAALSAGDAPMTKVILDAGGLPADLLSDALDAAATGNKPAIASLLEAAGVKRPVEAKLDAAQLARYAGTYRSAAGAAGADVTVAVTDGRLVLRTTQTIPLAARSETVFAAPAQPGYRVTFTIENGKVVALKSPTATYTRTGGQ